MPTYNKWCVLYSCILGVGVMLLVVRDGLAAVIGCLIGGGVGATIGACIGWTRVRTAAGVWPGAMGSLTVLLLYQSPLGDGPRDLLFFVEGGFGPRWAWLPMMLVITLSGAVPPASIAATRDEPGHVVLKLTSGWTAAALLSSLVTWILVLLGDPSGRLFGPVLISCVVLAVPSAIWGALLTSGFVFCRSLTTIRTSSSFVHRLAPGPRRGG